LGRVLGALYFVLCSLADKVLCSLADKAGYKVMILSLYKAPSTKYQAQSTKFKSICLNPKPVSPVENQKRTVLSASGFHYGSNELATKVAELLSVSVFLPAIGQL